jgi:hypothetical protein
MACPNERFQGAASAQAPAIGARQASTLPFGPLQDGFLIASLQSPSLLMVFRSLR